MGKFNLFLVLILSGCSGAVTLENDWANPFQKNVDKYYSHGSQFSYIKENEDQKETFSVGQTIYTPSVKRPDADIETLKKDRPYTGWLYGGYRATSYTDETTKDTFGIQIGCTGRCSQAKEVQRGVHKILDQGQPTWDRAYSLKSEPGVVLEIERSHLLTTNSSSDLSIYEGIKAGNIIDSGFFGIEYRLGSNLDKFRPEPITFKTAKEKEESKLIAYMFIRGEERLVLYNHLLEGSLWQKERHTVNAETFVHEADIGFTVGKDNFKLTYILTGFSSEWEEKRGGHAFGSVNIGW